MRQGFTLAEVLVTLGIIGVVSAMTIPTLMRNHQKQVYVTQLKKVYSAISQAADSAMTEHNAVSLEEVYRKAPINFLKDNFKIVQTCDTSPYTPCLADSYKYMDGTKLTLSSFPYGMGSKCVSTADGSSICIGNRFDHSYEISYLYLGIDINGPEGPNIMGRDVFYAELYSDGKLSESYNRTEGKREACVEDMNYFGCLATIINAGWKMDY